MEASAHGYQQFPTSAARHSDPNSGFVGLLSHPTPLPNKPQHHYHYHQKQQQAAADEARQMTEGLSRNSSRRSSIVSITGRNDGGGHMCPPAAQAVRCIRDDGGLGRRCIEEKQQPDCRWEDETSRVPQRTKSGTREQYERTSTRVLRASLAVNPKHHPRTCTYRMNRLSLFNACSPTLFLPYASLQRSRAPDVKGRF